MSFKYKLLKGVVRLAGVKKGFEGTPESLVAKAREQNAKVKIPERKDDEIEVSRIEVMGFPVLRMVHRRKASRANLFIIGGGMVKCPRPKSVQKALRIAKLTGLDLYVPYYPLCTDHPVTRSYEMIHETYKLMLRDYRAKDISVLGTSSGGNLALGIVAYINANKLDTPMPGSILAISPGTCIDTEEERARILELDRKDLLIPASYMDNAEKIMAHGQEVPKYMLRLQTGDFTNCPKVTLMYGSDECLYAFAPSFERRFREFGVPYRLIVGKGMFHVYPVFPICREAREGWDQMIEILKDGN